MSSTTSSALTTTSIANGGAESFRYIGGYTGPGGANLPLDLTLFFNLRRAQVNSFGRPLAIFDVTGGYNTGSGPGSFAGKISGQFDGTPPDGIFIGEMTAELPGCLAVRRYSGPMTREALNWSPGDQINACGGATPLVSPVTAPRTDQPPSTTTIASSSSSSTTTSVGGSTSIPTTSTSTTTTSVTTTSTSTTSSTSTSSTSSSTTSSTSTSTTSTTVPAVVLRTVTPNPPVPFSGQPITVFPQCVGVPNTWFYDDLLTNNSSVLVTITRIVDRLDGVVTNDRIVNSPMPPGTSRITNYQWCSGSSGQHTVLTSYTIVDVNNQPATIEGPTTIILLAKPFEIRGPRR